MPSPICVVSDNGGAFASTLNGVDVIAGDTLTIQLQNPAGVTSWTLACTSTDDQSTPLSVTVSGTQRTVVIPNGGNGQAYQLTSVINQGRDANGKPQTSYTTTFGVFVRSPNGGRVIFANETFETNPNFGWVADLNKAIRSAGGATVDLSGRVYTTNTLLTAQSQWVPCNTANGSFTVTFSAAAAQPCLVAITDTGHAFNSKPLTVNGNGLKVFNPDGPFAGTLQNTYVLSVNSETYNFALVPADPTNTFTTAPYWMPVGDGTVAFAPFGVFTGNVSLNPLSQWIPCNTANGSFTVTLPFIAFGAIQIVVTDTGLVSGTKPITLNGGGFQIWNPTGPHAGTLQQTYTMQQNGSTYVFNLVPADVTNPLTASPFWMPV